MKFVDEFDDKNSSDPQRDIPNRRLIYLQNGRQLGLERRNPYGFVYVVWDRGAPPTALSGSYTDFTLAQRGLMTYLNNNTFETVSEEPTKAVEPLKYKKAFRDPKTGENLPVNG